MASYGGFAHLGLGGGQRLLELRLQPLHLGPQRAHLLLRRRRTLQHRITSNKQPCISIQYAVLV